MVAISTDTSGAMTDLSVPGVVEVQDPLNDAGFPTVVLDEVGCGEFP